MDLRVINSLSRWERAGVRAGVASPHPARPQRGRNDEIASPLWGREHEISFPNGGGNRRKQCLDSK
jgi:hypothetical protein